MSVALLSIQVKADGVSQAESKLDGLSKASAKAEKSVDGLSKASGTLVSALGAMGVAMGALGLITLADNWSDLNSRVRLAAGSMEEGADVMERLADMARRTYSDINQTTESYLNNSTALRELGYNTEQTLDFTEALNNAFVVSGAKAQRAESVMNALSKAMAGGRLAGLELNTVIQTGGRVAELLAAELGTTVAGLRALGAEGQITGDLIYKTMTKNLELLREEAESMPATIGDAFTLMRNSILQNVGVLDQAGKVSETFAGTLILVADNMKYLVNAGGALALVLGARVLGGAIVSSGAALVSLAGSMTGMSVAAAAATTSATALNAALTAIGGPAGVAVAGISYALYNFSQRAAEAEAIAESYAEVIKRASEESDGAAGSIERMAQSMQWLKEGATEAQRMEALNATMREQKLIAAAMTEEYNKAGSGLLNLRTGMNETYRAMGPVIERFQKGELSAEEFNKELDRLAKQNPDLSSLIASIQKTGNEAAAAAGKVLSLSSAMALLGSSSGKGDRLNKNNAIKDHEEMLEFQLEQMKNFALRYGDIQASLGAGAVPPETTKPSGGGGGKPSGGGGGGASSDITRLESDMKSRLDVLKQGFMSENELRLEQYAQDMETLNFYLENKKMTETEYLQWKDRINQEAFEMRNLGEIERLQLAHEKEMETLKLYLDEKKITEEEFFRWKEEATQQHEEKLMEIRGMQYAAALDATGDLMGSMAQVIGSGNDKMLKAQKIFGAASALVSTYIGAAKALELPFPANLAAMATVLAKGMSLVAAIKSGSKSNSSGGGAVGNTQSAAPERAPDKRQAAEIKLHGEVFNRDMVAELIGKINDMGKDGYVIDVVTA